MSVDFETIGKKARQASYFLATVGTSVKNAALAAMRDALKSNLGKIMSANGQDVLEAQKSGMSKTMIDRLVFDIRRIEAAADSLNDIIELPDPVGKKVYEDVRPNGLKIERVTVPFGVIGVIYESRPNVTVDSAALCLKAGSAVILRGGKETIRTNCAITEILQNALKSVGFPAEVVQIVNDTSRESAEKMMRLDKYIDVLIPRGGAGLINAVVENSTVPVIKTGTGNCHVYVDDSADVAMAADIILNGKTSRPSVCNAVESVLIHEKISRWALPIICERLVAAGVEIFGDETVCSIVKEAKPATEEDWGREYLDRKISVKVVKNVHEAAAHINEYGTHHSDAIITQNNENAEKFLHAVDSAAVYVNASTRFTDGGEFGFGAEIGISTQKLHARGPVGLPSLVTAKYLIRGKGQIRT